MRKQSRDTGCILCRPHDIWWPVNVGNGGFNDAVMGFFPSQYVKKKPNNSIFSDSRGGLTSPAGSGWYTGLPLGGMTSP